MDVRKSNSCTFVLTVKMGNKRHLYLIELLKGLNEVKICKLSKCIQNRCSTSVSFPTVFFIGKETEAEQTCPKPMANNRETQAKTPRS